MPISFTYNCLAARQREGAEVPEFCLFFAPAGDVLAWAAVDRIQEAGPGFQRLSNPSRVRGVKRFFEQDARNTIPTAVVVTLRVPPEALTTAGAGAAATLTLQLPDAATEMDKPGLVIDGQHRLAGTNAFSPSALLPVVGLLNPSDLEAAFQFLVINNKSAKVPPDHIRRLALNFNRDGLELRLHTARLSLKKNYALVGRADEEDGSPFRGLVRWPTPTAQDRPVVPAAIESALQYIEGQDLQPLKDDTDALLEFFYAVWNAVREHWVAVWNTPESHLLSKVGIVCQTQYLTDSLAKLYEFGEVNLADPEQVATKVRVLLGNQNPDFWTSRWKDGSLDTATGRQLVVDDLTRVARNRRAGLSWFEELVTVNRPEAVAADF